MAKRKYGDGAIEPRGPGKFRLRYAIDGKRFSKTVTGTKTVAQEKLRELMTAGDKGASDPSASLREPYDNCAFRPGSPEQADTAKWKELIAKLRPGGNAPLSQGRADRSG
jgi:hypothetical protein